MNKLFRDAKARALQEEINASGYSSIELRADINKMKKIADKVSDSLLASKEVELFTVLFSLIRHYEKGSEICFDLRSGYDNNTDPIDSLQKLLGAIEENSPVDFSILSKAGIRRFQHKRYIDKTATTESLFLFIKKQLAKYGNKLDDVNLFVVLQVAGNLEVSFHELANKLHTIDLKSFGTILVSYNENNQFDVVNTVYPTLGTSRQLRPKFR